MFKKQPRKYILANGCSFTDPNFRSVYYPDYDSSFPKWPEVLGNKLGVEVLNIGDSGKDNATIVDEVIDQILIEKPWMVVLGLTEIPRFRMYGAQVLQSLPGQLLHLEKIADKDDFLLPAAPEEREHLFLMAPWHNWFWKQNIIRNDWLFSLMCSDHFKRLIRLQKLCDRLGIKLIMTHLLPMVSYWSHFYHVAQKFELELNLTEKDIARSISNSPNFYDVDEKTIIGWPHLHSINEGYYPFDMTSEEHIVGGEDKHPNELGHQLIAEYFYEHYQKTYT